jgi:hypothetical protein
MKQTFAYRVLRWVYHEARYRVVELPHRLSAAWSRRIGVTRDKRAPELIVSLTTIPERIVNVHLCLDTLLRQSVKPDRLILWLNESDDPDRPRVAKDILPEPLTRLQLRGLDVCWCRNIGAFTKIIPTMRIHPDALIVTADDDIFYPRHWLKELYESYLHEPQYIHCHRAHLMRYDANGRPLPYRQWDFYAPGFQGPSLDLFLTGVGGVLYAPGHLHPEVLNEGAFLELCPKNDDVWLKAMSLLNGVPCKKVAKESLTNRCIRIPNNRRLEDGNVREDGNDPQIRAVFDRYGLLDSASRESMRAGVAPEVDEQEAKFSSPAP